MYIANNRADKMMQWRQKGGKSIHWEPAVRFNYVGLTLGSGDWWITEKYRVQIQAAPVEEHLSSLDLKSLFSLSRKI